MTLTSDTGSSAAPSGGPPTPGASLERREDLVTLTIDGFEVSVPKGTLVIRAAERVGLQIPRFCDHPLLDPVGACRQCLVEVEGQRKPVASCTTTVSDGMVVRTQQSSAVADKAQQGVMELLLINHPLDCPMCDKGGECPLQNQAMSNGRPVARFDGIKRTYPKPIAISPQVLLDRERCVLCARCTRFSQQIAGDPFIEMLERSALQQVGIYQDEPFESYYSGNTIQICPVGALTSSAYRFRARPFDLVSTPTACEHCASGCALRTDHRRGRVMRRLAEDDPSVNEEWNCDKGRFAFSYATQPDRLSHPLVRDARSGQLEAASWPEALSLAARGLAAARGRTGVLVGGRATVEDAYGYAKFARVALATNDVDFRARVHSAEEADFLAAHVVGRLPGVTYADLERAPVVLLVGFEPEEESPIVLLRLRKAVREHGTRVLAIAPYVTRGLRKLDGTLVSAAPGTEPEILNALAAGDERVPAAALSEPGAVVLVGERLAGVAGGLSAALWLCEQTGARLAWVPRRAGERGALEAGALPTLLPGGRPVADPAARVDVGAAWGVTTLPSTPGRDTDGIIAAAADGSLAALLVGGVEVDDLPDPAAAAVALSTVPFLVSLEIRHSAVTQHADVVLPVAPVVDKAGTFVDWEGRERPFEAVLHAPSSMPDVRVLHALAADMGVDLRLPNVQAARDELAEIGHWDGERSSSPATPAQEPPQPAAGQAALATWRTLLDAGRLQDGEPYLAATAPRAVVRLSAATAAEVGASEGEPLTVAGPLGSLTLPLVVTDMPDRVVWVPANAPGSRAQTTLGVRSGGLVSITSGGAS